MKYEIAFISRYGSTEKLMYGIADHLPIQDTIVTDLSGEALSGRADVYFIGFGVNQGRIPLKIMDVLDEMEGKTFLLFVTCAAKPSEEAKAAIEKELDPFLPDDCDYRGMFLCRGQVPEEMIRSARAKLEENPYHDGAKELLKEAEAAKSHPDQNDVENACSFIREHLG